jgi:hypothetical protein
MPTVRRAPAVTALLVAGVAGLAGCGLDRAEFSVDSTETATVTEIRLTGGGSGNVSIAPAEDGKTHIHREVRYAGEHSDVTPFHLEGTVLVVTTDCGWRCSISYEIRTPRGVKVTGDTSSGDVRLTNVSDVDIHVDSGSVFIDAPTGTVKVAASSGNIEVNGAEKDLEMRVDSGRITARGVRSPQTIAQTSSGKIELRLAAAGNVQASADSGGITLDVPGGAQGYRVQASVDSGTKTIDVPLDPDSPYLLDLSADSGDITVRNITT